MSKRNMRRTRKYIKVHPNVNQYDGLLGVSQGLPIKLHSGEAVLFRILMALPRQCASRYNLSIFSKGMVQNLAS